MMEGCREDMRDWSTSEYILSLTKMAMTELAGLTGSFFSYKGLLLCGSLDVGGSLRENGYMYKYH